ncbi:MAG: alpha/beta hydrolase [Firmicutes bacterium]|nr:alpha/beta hydrolase [Bacillota bacterium]
MLFLICGFQRGAKVLVKAQAFAAAGFAALTFDYQSFGASEGERGRLNPAEQIIDIRSFITFLQTLPEVEPERIGLWGSSYGGANILGRRRSPALLLPPLFMIFLHSSSFMYRSQFSKSGETPGFFV